MSGTRRWQTAPIGVEDHALEHAAFVLGDVTTVHCWFGAGNRAEVRAAGRKGQLASELMIDL